MMRLKDGSFYAPNALHTSKSVKRQDCNLNMWEARSWNILVRIEEGRRNEKFFICLL